MDISLYIHRCHRIICDDIDIGRYKGRRQHESHAPYNKQALVVSDILPHTGLFPALLFLYRHPVYFFDLFFLFLFFLSHLIPMHIAEYTDITLCSLPAPIRFGYLLQDFCSPGRCPHIPAQ